MIDTNVIVAALKSQRGAANRLLRLFGANKFIHSISVALVLEYEEVIKRLLPDISGQKINHFLDYICAVSENTKIYYLWRPTLKDPEDDMVLELAVASESDYIVTYNQKDFKGAKHFGIKIDAERITNINGRIRAMHAISIKLPHSLHQAAKELAKKEHISINQLINLAVAEKLSVLGVKDFIESRSKRGSRAKFLKVLETAPDVEPDEEDKL